MELISNVYGKIEYNNSEIIEFKKGILGFDNFKNFIVRNIEGNPIFKTLHSVDDGDIAFVVVSPFDCMEEYEIELGRDVLDNLEIKDPTEVVLYSVVTVNSEIEKLTANLKAPIILNCKKMIGKQVILNRDEYLVKHSIFEEG